MPRYIQLNGMFRGDFGKYKQGEEEEEEEPTTNDREHTTTTNKETLPS